MSSLLKFERKVQESVVYISCDGNNDGDHKDSDLGVVAPRAIILPPKLHMKAPAFTKVTGNFWDLGYKTETQPKWLFFEAPGAP